MLNYNQMNHLKLDHSGERVVTKQNIWIIANSGDNPMKEI